MSAFKRVATIIVLFVILIPAYAGVAVQFDLQAPAWMYERATGLAEVGIILLTLAVTAFWPSPKGGDVG